MKTALILGTITLLSLSAVFLFTAKQNQTYEFQVENVFPNQNLSQPQTLSTDYCPEPLYRDEDSFNTLLAGMKQQNFSTEKLEYIEEEVPKDPRVFSKDQVKTLLNELNFTELKVKAMKFLEPYITYFETKEIIELINAISFSSEKLEVLTVLAPLLSDATDENKEKIATTCFSMSSDKDKARQILKDIASRNCVFGTVTENVATFIIDISPSMEYKFKTSDGKTMTRLQFVREHLKKTIAEQLKDYQLFNVIALYESAKAWQSDNVSANQENIDKALNWIDSLRVISATNLSAPLELAFKSKQQLEAIYMLTDGSPNRGITNIDQMSDFVNRLVASRSPAVRINTISFMLGGSESASERASAQQFLEVIATNSQGSFKQME